MIFYPLLIPSRKGRLIQDTSQLAVRAVHCIKVFIYRLGATMKGVYSFFLFLIFLCIIAVKESPAEPIYSYIDKDGTKCFTDSLQSIPEAYRKKAVPVSGQSEKEAERQAGTPAFKGRGINPGAVSADERKGHLLGIKDRISEAFNSSVRSRAFRPVAGITGFLLVFLLIGKVSRLTGYGKAGSVIRIALTVFVLLYIFNSYLKEIADSFAMLKHEVSGVKKKAEERDEKVTDKINELFKEKE